jgi:hypothetical protein
MEKPMKSFPPWTAVGSASATPLWMFHRPSSSRQSTAEESKAVSPLHSAPALHTTTIIEPPPQRSLIPLSPHGLRWEALAPHRFGCFIAPALRTIPPQKNPKRCRRCTLPPHSTHRRSQSHRPRHPHPSHAPKPSAPSAPPRFASPQLPSSDQRSDFPTSHLAPRQKMPIFPPCPWTSHSSKSRFLPRSATTSLASPDLRPPTSDFPDPSHIAPASS